ncbi:hypothetical protein NBRC116592_34530 [Colwellia sp. KU-HH00111]|uniref:NACHT and WD repeat domain-containing protein n=1 Tax=Colwellia sp. KU-HH00111 TaxID=3127652 RepID=UPI00310B0360
MFYMMVTGDDGILYTVTTGNDDTEAAYGNKGGQSDFEVKTERYFAKKDIDEVQIQVLKKATNAAYHILLHKHKVAFPSIKAFLNVETNKPINGGLTADSKSAGLSYAATLAVNFLQKITLKKPNEGTHFFTGIVTDEGLIEKINELDNKINNTCNFIEGQENLPGPYRVFFPSINNDDIQQNTRDRVKALAESKKITITLHPVSHIQQALEIMGYDLFSKIENPYRSLHSYRYEHQELFFGRDIEIQNAITEINKHPNSLFMIHGHSGSGKSSIVQAGVLPALEKNIGQIFYQSTITPNLVKGKNDKALQLIKALLLNIVELQPLNLPELCLNQVWEDKLIQIIEKLESPVFLCIDQFEEATTSADFKQTEIESVLSFLKTLSNALPDKLYAFICMRSDDIKHIYKNYYFAYEVHSNKQQRALNIREIIEKPAEQLGKPFPQELVDKIEQEAIHLEHVLPQLSFYLYRYWNGETSHGLKDEIVKVLEEKVDEFSAHNGAMNINLFLELVVAIWDGKLRKKRAYKKYLEIAHKEFLPLFEVLVDKQLMIKARLNNDVYFELTHDVLVNVDDNSWKELSRYCGEYCDYLEWFISIEEQYLSWLSHERLCTVTPDLLLNTASIARVQEIQEKCTIHNKWVVKYLSQSMQQETDKANKEKYRFRLVAGMAVVMMVLAGIAFLMWNKSEASLEVAEINERLADKKTHELLKLGSQGLMAKANKEFEGGNYLTSTLLGLNAIPGIYGGERPVIEDNSVLLKSYSSILPDYVFEPDEEIKNAFFDVSGDSIFIVNQRGFGNYSLLSNKVNFEVNENFPIMNVSQSRNGEFIVAISADKTIKVYKESGERKGASKEVIIDMNPPNNNDRIVKSSSIILDSIISDDSKYIVATHMERHTLWDIETLDKFNDIEYFKKKFGGNPEQLFKSYLSKNKIVSLSASGDVHQVNIKTGLKKSFISKEIKRNRLIAYDGNNLLSVYVNETINGQSTPQVKLLNIHNGDITSVVDPGYGLRGLEFINNGRTLLTIGNSLNFYTIDENDQLTLEKHIRLPSSFNNYALSPNKTKIAFHNGKLISTWDISSMRLLSTHSLGSNKTERSLSQTKKVTLAWSNDNKILAIRDNKVYVWKLNVPKQKGQIFESKYRESASGQYSPSGKFVVNYSNKNIQVLDSKTGKELYKTNFVKGKLAFGVNAPQIHQCKNGDEYISVGKNNGSVDFWPIDNYSKTKTLLHDTTSSYDERSSGRLIFKITFDSTCQNIITTGNNAQLKVWNAKSLELLHTFNYSRLLLNRLIFIDDNTLITTNGKNELKLRNYSTMEVIHTLTLPGKVLKLFYSPQKNTLMTVSDVEINNKSTSSFKLTLWSLSSGAELNKSAFNRNIHSVEIEFSSNGEYIALSNIEKSNTTVYGTSNLEELYTLNDSINPIFTPDSAALFTLESDGYIAAVQPVDGKAIAYLPSIFSEFNNHNLRHYSLAINDDNLDITYSNLLWRVPISTVLKNSEVNLDKLPINKRCLSAEERKRFFLPMLTREQISERECINYH